jgi:hypothetical protein
MSYPAIESYLLSCIKDDTVKLSFKLGKDVKAILANERCPDDGNNTVDLFLSEDTAEAEMRLIHSINEMDSGLKDIGIQTYDLDNLAPTLLDVYDHQQQKYNDEGVFALLSLVGMALLELGVIIECDEDVEQ